MVVPLPGAAVTGLQVFAFGKLPSHGDFVARGLASAERQAWDDWASAELEAARQALGDGFPAAHDQALPWRFVFGGSALGAGRRAGVIAPSIDAAGRRFVIVLGVRAPEGLAAHGPGAEAAERLEAQLYRAFQEGLDVDGLVAGAAAALAQFDPGAPASGGRFWSAPQASVGRAELTAEAPPPGLLLRMLEGQAPGHG